MDLIENLLVDEKYTTCYTESYFNNRRDHMDLRTYLFTHRMTATAMARKLGVTIPYMGQIVRLKTPPSRSLAKLIEIETQGEVTELELLQPWKD